MRNNTGKMEKALSNRYELVSNSELIPTISIKGDSIAMEGYLYKRTSSKFKSWNRRWFIIEHHQLKYRKRLMSGGEKASVMENDLRLCNARILNDIDRRFCFEVFSPTK